MARALCIHGHFYQPPRENPWLDEIERQDSAAPYHDWNERITAECYAPNAAARILGPRGAIRRIASNYERLSFDFGPTLLSWLSRHRPAVYAGILAADRASAARFGGHGSAMAQAYHHLILPLASSRDKETQVAWGLRDFAARFGRPSAGLWFPETAVDLESLDLAAAHGVRFTVLEPHQARRVRPLGREVHGEEPAPWRDARGGRVDTGVPYRVALPSGRSLSVFFYDGALARAVAFERLLVDGDRFAAELAGAAERAEGHLAHFATDGETYGHHHAHGDMALAAAFDRLEHEGRVRLTNYAEHLAHHPPLHEAEIVEASSWSCAHGVDRWRDDCGCRTGGEPAWNQAWRAPLRDALDSLRDALVPRYAEAAGELFNDPWAARNGYIDLLLDRSAPAIERFFLQHGRGGLDRPARVRALRLLELQRQTLLMYTSCGWFFSDLGGIETVQILRYAGRALELATALLGGGFEPDFLRRLAWAQSNDPRIGNGRELYDREVRPAVVDTAHLVAHHAMRSLFAPPPAVLYGHALESEGAARRETAGARLELGRVRVVTLATGAAERFYYGAVSLGSHDPHVAAGVRLAGDDDRAFTALEAKALAALDHGKVQQVVQLLDHELGLRHSLDTLRGDAREELLGMSLEPMVGEVEAELRDRHRRTAPVLRYLSHLGAPAPPALLVAAQFVLNADLERALRAGDAAAAAALLAEAAALGTALDAPRLAAAAAATLGDLLERTLVASVEDDALGKAVAWSRLVRSAPFEVDLWQAQNLAVVLRDQTLAGHDPSLDGEVPVARRAEVLALCAALGVAGEAR